ncbi:MAG TPA: dihydrolipoyl dehydrogenase [Thermoanaerobaculia bacterium]|nr:dihydrolipoyl dehydrogenase [Thermoanaerobaculia bacterium]
MSDTENDELDLIVVGAGPGGYIAAIRAAQLGLEVACVDENATLGGTCLRIGCIPSKALLESSERFAAAGSELAAHGVVVAPSLDLDAMMKRKDKVVKALTGGVRSLFKKNGVRAVRGRARLVAPGRVEVEGEDAGRLEAKHLLLAPGSHPATLPGVELDGDRIGTATEALGYDRVPQRLVVIGAGAIGLELGSVWCRLGAEVVVLEYLDCILPGMDAEIAEHARKILAKQGLDLRLGRRVTGARVDGDRCVVETEGGDPVECDRVLVAVGRRPATEDLGLAAVGVETDERGFIRVDGRFCTTVDGIYAIGDAIGGALLAHKAEEEGVACVEGIVGGAVHVNYDAIPSVVYTEPEVAAVGRTEEQLQEAGIPYRKGTFPWTANGRARALGHVDGLTKVLAHERTDRVLGVHVVGSRAGDLIAEAVAAIAFGASAEDLATISHAHPTLAETIKEAALASAGRALNI